MNLFAEFDETYPNLVFIKTMQRVQRVTGIAIEQTEQTVTGLAKKNNNFPKKLPFFYF
ncbi:MAG: hypothetical protein KIG96_11815 [Treponema sp.]|nr:hypothetical protein [Treponema sp.]